jgi:hypothetical protein
MDASSQTRKGASSQESLDDKNDICLRGLFKIPPLAPRPAGGTVTFSAAILPMPVSPPCCGLSFLMSLKVRKLAAKI